jgi:hypothetical protein
MSDQIHVYNVLIPEKYIGRDKMERTSYFQVGTAFPTKDGSGMQVRLAPGVTVAGSFIILPRESREERDARAQQGRDAGSTEDDDFPL